MNRRIVCLCGSTKFKDAYEKANFDESLNGNIILSVGCYAHADEIPLTPTQKINLDELHLRKIDLADEIFVLNVGGYIGKSTSREILYASKLQKTIKFLEPFE